MGALIQVLERFDNRSAMQLSRTCSWPGLPGGRPKVSTRALCRVIERSSRTEGPAQAYVGPPASRPPGGQPRQIVTRETLLVGADGPVERRWRAATLLGSAPWLRMVRRGRRGCRGLEATALFVLALQLVHSALDHRRTAPCSCLGGAGRQHWLRCQICFNSAAGVSETWPGRRCRRYRLKRRTKNEPTRSS